MSLPQFKIDMTVGTGTAVLCTVERPVVDVAKVVPPSVNSLTVRDLLVLWDRVARIMPDERRGEWSAGVAIDLYARNAKKAAVRVLGNGVVDRSWHSDTIRQVRYLMTFGNAKYRQPLMEIDEYLRARRADSL